MNTMSSYMYIHMYTLPVYATALDAQHDAQVDGGPFGAPATAVSTPVIAWHVQEIQTQRVADGGREEKEEEEEEEEEEG